MLTATPYRNHVKNTHERDYLETLLRKDEIHDRCGTVDRAW